MSRKFIVAAIMLGLSGLMLTISCSVVTAADANAPVYAPVSVLSVAGQLYSAASNPLPSCNSAANGQRAVVSDAAAPAYMASYTSGGAITAEVICSYNGTSYSWLTH